MPILTDRKKPLVISLSAGSRERLDGLNQRFGWRPSQTVLTAWRWCGAVHGCNQEQLFYKNNDGIMEQFRVCCCRPQQVAAGPAERLVLQANLADLAKLKSCGRQAGGLTRGVDVCLWVLERLTSPAAPRFYERRGGQYYRLSFSN